MRTGISPKVDYVFKRLFGSERSRPSLVHFLNSALHHTWAAGLTQVQLLNPFNEKDALDDKLSIVDVKARDQRGRLCHVEMQVLPERAFRSRVLYYWAELHRQQMTEGEPYASLRPTISVCIVDFPLFPQVPDYRLQFELRDVNHNLVFSPDLFLVTLELPKFNRHVDELETPLDRWLYFPRHGEDLDVDNLPATLQVPEIVHVLEELTMLSQNDVERERYLARVKMQRDQLSRLHSAREDGLEQGLEQGLEKGVIIGAIHVYERLLKRPLTARDQLLQLTPTELQQLAEQLEKELPH